MIIRLEQENDFPVIYDLQKKPLKQLKSKIGRNKNLLSA